MAADRVILAYSCQSRQLPALRRATLRAQLPYGRRMRLGADLRAQDRTLVGIELACQLLAQRCGRSVVPGELRFPSRGKPWAPGLPEFSISHSGAWVGCAVATRGRIGFDLECNAADARHDLADWTAREAVLKAAGAKLDAYREVAIDGDVAWFAGGCWILRRPPAPPGCVATLALEHAAEIGLVTLAADPGESRAS